MATATLSIPTKREVEGETLIPLPPQLQPLAVELETFYRNLRRLIDDGLEGKHVVIRDRELHETWDTFGDAVKYGYRVFGDGRFLAQVIDPRLEKSLARHFGPLVEVEKS